MKIIVGLCNPGDRYLNTRHNVGADVLDRLARRFAPGEVARRQFHGCAIDATIESQRVLLLKPETFMNRSGTSVSEAVNFYKVAVETDLLVLVDDIALGCGVIRVRADGSPGGHNGLIDIEQALGTNAYARLRIGIDAPGTIPQSDYVLGRFRPDQREAIEPALDEAADAAVTWCVHDVTTAMNRHNRRNEPPQTESPASRHETGNANDALPRNRDLATRIHHVEVA